MEFDHLENLELPHWDRFPQILDQRCQQRLLEGSCFLRGFPGNGFRNANIRIVQGQVIQWALLATMIEDLRETIPMRQFQIFEMVKLHEMPPGRVAQELGVSRGVVDNTVYKVKQRLREIASAPEYQSEYYL